MEAYKTYVNNNDPCTPYHYVVYIADNVAKLSYSQKVYLGRKIKLTLLLTLLLTLILTLFETIYM